MPAKGTISADHYPRNEYQLQFDGLPPITATRVSGLDQSLSTTRTPDRRVLTGGNIEPTSYDISVPAHHVAEQIALRTWFRDCQFGETGGGASPNYKRSATLIQFNSITGKPTRTTQIIGTFPVGNSNPDLAMDDEGSMTEIVWSFVCDEFVPSF